MHFLGCLASFPARNELDYMVKPWAMSPLKEETSIDVDEHIELPNYC